MNTENIMNQNLSKKVIVSKKRVRKAKKYVPKKFNKEGFFMAWGLAVVCGGIGILIIWTIKTASEGTTQSTGFTAAQRLGRILPESIKETLAFILGSLFLLFAIFCIFRGLKIVAKYISGKLRD